MAASYDAIVIGSGAGGLAAALPLAQAGRRVLVVEQHDRPGGYTHSFTLGGHQFSPGVHYVGQLGPGGMLRRVYEGLGVSGDMVWCEMDPDGYDRVFIGDERIDLPKGLDALIARLQQRFPEDAAGIEDYCRLVDQLMQDLRTLRRAKGLRLLGALPSLLRVLRWAPKTARAMIDAHVQDPVARALLAAQCGDHGLPPDHVPAVLHAGISQHYYDGAYYPHGGGQSIPKAFVKALKRAGGEIRLSCPADRILLRGGRVQGVRLADGSEVHAPVVVSNADPEVTFGHLVGRDRLPRRLRRRLDATTYSASAVTLFFATDMDLRAAGVGSGNMWCYNHADIDALAHEALEAEPGVPGAFFVSFSTLKDPTKGRGEHTGEAIAFVGPESFSRWKDSATGERPADYEALKADLADQFFHALDRRIPGIRDHITFWDLATPLTYQHYVNATRGALYGTAKTFGQMGPRAYPTKTPIRGLYMAGASTFSFGVAGATMTGLAAAARILDRPVRDLLEQQGPPLRVFPSDDLEAWPDDLLPRVRVTASAA